MNIMDILNVPIGYIMEFCNLITSNISYALTLLLFTVITQIILFPLGIKQQKGQQKQARLRPKEMAIRKRYAGRTDKATQQKMQQEVMDLYQKENYNPVGGCLPLLIQFPLILALYNVIRNPLTYICHLGTDAVKAVYDGLVNLGIFSYNAEKSIYTIVETGKQVLTNNQIDIMRFVRDNADALNTHLESLGFETMGELPNFHLFGNSFDLSLVPSQVFSEQWWIIAIPVLTFAFQFFSMKLTRKFTYQAPTDEANVGASMKIMDLMMPLMSVFFAFSLPAVLGVYWCYQSAVSVAKQFALSKMYPIPVFTEEDYKKAEKEMNGSIRRDKKKEQKKSLHHIDDDEVAEAKKAESKKKVIDRPEMKENSDGSAPAPRVKSEGGKKSLHYIDEEEFPNGKYPDVDEYLAAKKAEKEAAAQADAEPEKTELNGEIQE